MIQPNPRSRYNLNPFSPSRIKLIQPPVLPANRMSDNEYANYLYQENYVRADRGPAIIPKIIHQIWLGGSLPDKYKRLCDSWKRFHPDWEYRLWTDEDIPSIRLTNPAVFNAATNQGLRADILRYDILRQYGGLYVDTDFECLRPFDDLLYLKFFAGTDCSTKLLVYSGLICCVPNHPIIMECVMNYPRPYGGNRAQTIIDFFGPVYVTKCFLRGARSHPDGVVAFPWKYFYPLPNKHRRTKTPYKYVWVRSYAIHHWEVSWLKK